MTANRKTLKRFENLGDARFLTFSCYQRRCFLLKERCNIWMAEALELARQQHGFDLWAYVFMPEHVHLLIKPPFECRFGNFLATMKLSVARRALSWLKTHAPEYLEELQAVSATGKVRFHFWQRGGGYDRNLRSVRDVHEKIAYIHQNPVRRGLADNPEAWHWSSAAAWASGIDEPIRMDRESVPRLTTLDDDLNSPLLG